MEHYIQIEARHASGLILKPARPDEEVRIRADGFVTMGDGQEVFAALDMWDPSDDGDGQLDRLAYILKETPRDEVSDEGVDRFIAIEFGRIKPFLRVPEGPDSPVFVYTSGFVTLAPDDLPLAQMRDWEEEDIWKLTQLADRHGAVIMTKTDPPEDVPMEFEDESDSEDQEFW